MRGLLMLLVVALLAACTSMQELLARRQPPELGFRYGELLYEDGFETGAEWRAYETSADLYLGVRAGAFRIEFSGRQYVWSQRAGQHRNVVIEADSRQVSEFDHNAYGLACRLDPANSGRGYFFLISGDGHASIRWSNGRSLEPIVAAAPSAHIRQGQTGNRLRVLCIDDYLALWVNGRFVADARDGRSGQGEVGLVGVMNYAGARLAVEFDDISVWRAALDLRES
ncbi:MAG: hypothetical protein OXG68_08660 [Chloroflexi bacterium]|nr:hypothetical protein [Chloroflexota bacterium]